MIVVIDILENKEHLGALEVKKVTCSFLFYIDVVVVLEAPRPLPLSMFYLFTFFNFYFYLVCIQLKKMNYACCSLLLLKYITLVVE